MKYMSWEEQFNILKEYYLEYNNCKINKKHKLYNWSCRQRMDRKDGILTIEKENLLLSIDFKFNESWDEMFNKFLIYFKKYKTLEISQDNEFYNELNSWIKRQISLIKNNKLPKDKIRKYEELGILIERKRGLNEIWMNSYMELKQFYLDNNNCNIPNTNEYKSLYRFVQTQRTNYKNNKLSEEKIILLKEIKFVFDLWEDNYNIAKSYYLKYNSLIIDNDSDEFKSLRNWIYNTRQNYKNNKLTNKQIDLLKEIDFPFEVISCDKQWLNYYSKCKKFYESKKDYYNFSNDLYKGLFEWMLEQSKLYKTNKLSSYKLNLLNKINFDFNIYKYYGVEKEWLKSYFKLSKILKYNNSYYIDYRDNEDIKNWIINQCKCSKNLDNNKIYLLQEINFDFNLDKKLKIDYEWLENFNLIKNNKDLEVSNAIIKCSINSIKWIYEQYSLYNDKLLSEYQMSLLKSINFDKFKKIYKYTDIKWITFYKQLYRFYKSNNNYNINPFKHSENLFKWTLEQTRLFNSNLLSKTKINLLEAIHFDFNTQPLSKDETKWLKYYNKLKSFRKNYGHCMVDNQNHFKKLYIWTNKQKYLKEQGLLMDDFSDCLNRIDFEFTNSWDKMFNRFKTYYNLYESLNIPINKHIQYKEIDIWLKEQLRLFKKNELPCNIINSYNELGIDLNFYLE